jgi:hypothetical protein
MENDNRGKGAVRAGLCVDCRFMRLMRSDRASTFLRCELSATNKAFPKYPRLPVLQCAGYEPLRANSDRPADSSA